MLGMAISEAQYRANKKYDSAHYWSPTIRLPKEWEEEIRANGGSVNNFIVQAVAEKLGKDYAKKDTE